MSYQKFCEETGVRLKRYLDSGVSYEEAEFRSENDTIEEWLRSGKEHGLVSYLLSNYDTGGGDHVVFPTIEKLVKAGFKRLAERLQRGHLMLKLTSFWSLNSLLELNGSRWKKESPEGYRNSVDELESLTESIMSSIALCKQTSAFEDSELEQIRSQIKSGCKPKKATTDKRKVDERLFWTLITEAHEGAESTIEVVSALRRKLEKFSITEIKKFQKHLYRKLADIANWDIWALAYISRSGCGDDEFEYFRAWLIMQGKESYELALRDVILFAQQTSWSEDPQCEDALYVVQKAYENKKLEFMPNIVRPKEKMKGKKWSESELPSLYPELVKIFS